MTRLAGAVILGGIVALGLASSAGLHAQQFAALDVPFTATAGGQTGSSTVSGVFRITQFIEQNGSAFVVGDLAAGVGNGAVPRTVVTQVVVPILNASSASSLSSLNLAAPSASAVVPGSTVGTSTLYNPTTTGTTGTTGAAGTSMTTATGTTGTTTAGTTAGVASASTPGVQANCGPVHLEFGPIDESESGLHLDRLAVDLSAPVGTVTSLNGALCSADAALVQAVAGNGGSSTGTTPFVSSFSAAPGTTSAAAPTTALQGLVNALNQLLTAF